MALLVLGTIVVPYTQPVWCAARMSPMTRAAHDPMPRHHADAVTGGAVAADPSPCAPLCIATHVAPVSAATTTAVLDGARVAGPAVMPPAVSATPQSPTPPPKA